MRTLTTITSPTALPCPTLAPQRAALSVRLARPEEWDQVFRLRYEVFYREMGASDSVSLCPERDVDAYDALCDHLVALVGERIVGTYRMLPLGRLAGTGLGPYSAQEFDLSLIRESYGDDLLELGRSCVHPDFRDGRIPRLLWRGVLDYLETTQARALLGCVSVHHAGDAEALALFAHLKSSGAWRPELDATPMPAFTALTTGANAITLPTLPPLMKGYLSLGACVCGGPAMDRDFATADYLMLLDRNEVSTRHLRYLTRNA